MKRHQRHILGEARRIAAAHGLEIALVHAARHPKIVIRGRGLVRTTPLASSPRCADATIRLKLQDVRRLCREICSA